MIKFAGWNILLKHQISSCQQVFYYKVIGLVSLWAVFVTFKRGRHIGKDRKGMHTQASMSKIAIWEQMSGMEQDRTGW